MKILISIITIIFFMYLHLNCILDEKRYVYISYHNLTNHNLHISSPQLYKNFDLGTKYIFLSRDGFLNLPKDTSIFFLPFKYIEQYKCNNSIFVRNKFFIEFEYLSDYEFIGIDTIIVSKIDIIKDSFNFFIDCKYGKDTTIVIDVK